MATPRRRTILIALAAALGLTACGGSHTSPPTHPVPAVSLGDFIADSDFSFHVLRGPGGLTLALDADCGRHGSLSAEYDKARHGDLLSPVYTGPLHCWFARNLQSGTLTARWGRSLALDMTLTLRGTPQRLRQHPASGCGSTASARNYVAHGTLEDRIEGTSLGVYARSRITVSVTTIVDSPSSADPSFHNCEAIISGPSRPAPATALVAGDTLSTFGDEQLEASGDHGATPELDLNANLPDIAPGVQAELLLSPTAPGPAAPGRPTPPRAA